MASIRSTLTLSPKPPSARTHNCSEGCRRSETGKEPTPCTRQEEEAGGDAWPLKEFAWFRVYGRLGFLGFRIYRLIRRLSAIRASIVDYLKF